MTICSACGQENPAGSRFCNACGATLAEPAARAAEERKVVTVLFADLVGFTARSERLDPEDVRAILRPYHGRLKTELERFGGTVEKFIGDAVMAVFGAPVAHEDDPERAVRAAISIRDALAEDGGTDVRIGITTGEALVTLGARPEMGEGIASGDVVNTAARLQSGAAVNEILVDAKTYRATERAIDYEQADSVVAKGKAEPIPVWRAVRPHSRVGVERQGGAALVGRDNELALLRETLARVIQEGDPQLVTLVGVPGIGKSRLVYELFKAIEEGTYGLVYWRHGRSLPYGDGVTFWALAEMVKAQANILESDDTDDARAKLRASIADLPVDETEAAWFERHLAPLVGVGDASARAADRRNEAFAAWRRFFEVLGEQRPLVLVFEDLHWADDALLDFVDEIVEWARGVPILVLGTARPELLARRRDWGGGKVNSSTILVSPLSEHDSSVLLHALLGTAVLDADMQTMLLERSGGNPLYAEEFARMFSEQPTGVALPESVHGMIAARLDALPQEEKQLLQDASVLGRIFWVSGLAVDEEAAHDRLRALERKEFIRRERRSSVAGESEYAFRHALVRDVAYEQIPRNQRAEKHLAAAEWLESLGRPDDHAEMLAHHYVSALDLARTTGADVSADAARVRAALIGAGDRARSLNAMDAAARYYETALDFVDDADSQRPNLMYKLARAQAIVGHPQRDASLEAARDALLRIGATERAAEAEATLAEMSWHRGDRAACDSHLGRALDLVRDLPNSAGKVNVLSQVARFRMLAGEDRDALEFAQQALAVADELGLHELRAHSLNTIGTAKFHLGDTDGGIKDLEASVEIGRSVHTGETARALNNLGTLLWGSRGVVASRHAVEEAVRVARETGHALIWRHAYGQHLSQRLDAGEWNEAAGLADDFIVDDETGDRSSIEDSLRRRRARVRLARGDLAGACADIEMMLELSRRTVDPQSLIPSLGCATRFYVDAGMPAEATQIAEEFVRACGHEQPGWMVVDFAWAANATGHGSEARSLVAPDGESVYRKAIERLLDEDYAAAAAVFANIGEPENEAIAKLRAGQRLVAAGEPERARPLLEDALRFYRSVGGTHWIAEIEHARDGVTRPAPARARR